MEVIIYFVPSKAPYSWSIVGPYCIHTEEYLLKPKPIHGASEFYQDNSTDPNTFY